MTWHTPQPARYEVDERADALTVRCAYWSATHSRAHGGNISSAVFPHGSGRNIFAAPWSTSMRLWRGGRILGFANADDPDAHLAHGREGDRVWVQARSAFVSPEGERLPAQIEHRFTYHPWGYVRQRVTVTCREPIDDVFELQVARPVVASHLDEFTYRPAIEEGRWWQMQCKVLRWYRLHAGEHAEDYRAARRPRLPLYFLFLRRGVEGFDWFMADDLDQWRRQVADLPRIQEFRVWYMGEHDGYEVRLCPLHYWPRTMTLSGAYTFDFFVGLPFVQERVRPLVRCAGGMLTRKARGDVREFPTTDRVRAFGEHGVELARLHDDGPSRAGVFWRDCDYPPYGPERMRAMDACLRAMHDQGVRVVPYFSVHEWHPDVAPFDRDAPRFQRTTDVDGGMIYNTTSLGPYGAQMCLRSGWLELRKRTIDTVLDRHAFDGVYYDWTQALPCLNPAHGLGAHWDVEEFIDFLEWTRARVGPEGVVYLHMSWTPFIVAENLASVVLTFEEGEGPAKVAPDILPAHAQFMKTCPRVVLTRDASHRDPRRFLLLCLLNHVGPDAGTPEALAVMRATRGIDFTRYRAFEDLRTRAVRARSRAVRCAVYWNAREALVLLANLSDAPRPGGWRLSPARLGWGRDGYRVDGRAPARLDPLAFAYVRVKREG